MGRELSTNAQVADVQIHLAPMGSQKGVEQFAGTEKKARKIAMAGGDECSTYRAGAAVRRQGPAEQGSGCQRSAAPAGTRTAVPRGKSASLRQDDAG